MNVAPAMDIISKEEKNMNHWTVITRMLKLPAVIFRPPPPPLFEPTTIILLCKLQILIAWNCISYIYRYQAHKKN